MNHSSMSRYPDKPSKLTIMTWPLSSLWGKSLKEALSDTFTEKTGIYIHHAENIGLDFPSPLIESLEKGERPPFDILYANSIPSSNLARKDYCEPLDEEELPVLKKLNSRARPQAEGISGWPFANVYIVRYALMYRDSAFSGNEPDSWNVMLDKRFTGRISIYPGGKGFYPIAQVMGGGQIYDISDRMEPCWEFISSLKPQIGKMGYNKEMTGFVEKGEIDLFFTAFTNIYQWKKDGLGVSWKIPKEGTTDCMDSLVVPKYLPDNVKFWAKQYINHALSKTVQEEFCHRLGACPVHPGISPPDNLIDDPGYPQTPDDKSMLLYVPDSITVNYEESWMNKFNEIMEL